MRKWVSLCGMWIASVVPAARAPMPDRAMLSQPRFRGDFCAMPYIAAIGAKIPADVMPRLTSFVKERSLKRVIAPSPRRVATAWLGENIMIGVQFTDGKRRGSRQFHPATIHWKMPKGDIGWIRLKCSAAVNATASGGKLHIAFRLGEPKETCYFEISASGAALERIEPGSWSLPGLTLQVGTNAAVPAITKEGGSIKVLYRLAKKTKGQTVSFTFLPARTENGRP